MCFLANVCKHFSLSRHVKARGGREKGYEKLPTHIIIKRGEKQEEKNGFYSHRERELLLNKMAAFKNIPLIKHIEWSGQEEEMSLNDFQLPEDVSQCRHMLSESQQI